MFLEIIYFYTDKDISCSLTNQYRKAVENIEIFQKNI
jgi:hypothetical protein